MIRQGLWNYQNSQGEIGSMATYTGLPVMLMPGTKIILKDNPESDPSKKLPDKFLTLMPGDDDKQQRPANGAQYAQGQNPHSHQQQQQSQQRPQNRQQAIPSQSRELGQTRFRRDENGHMGGPTIDDGGPYHEY